VPPQGSHADGIKHTPLGYSAPLLKRTSFEHLLTPGPPTPRQSASVVQDFPVVPSTVLVLPLLLLLPPLLLPLLLLPPLLLPLLLVLPLLLLPPPLLLVLLPPLPEPLELDAPLLDPLPEELPPHWSGNA
jgi:hypothetical protein